MSRKFYEVMSSISRKLWTRITLEMAWYYRKGGTVQPKLVSKYTNKLPDTKEEWERIRAEINALRAKAKEEVIEKVKRDRRDYMRLYMMRYRRREHDRTDA